MSSMFLKTEIFWGILIINTTFGIRSLCADVRPIIRAVFRELDYLPPLTTEVPSLVANDYLKTALKGSPGGQWVSERRTLVYLRPSPSSYRCRTPASVRTIRSIRCTVTNYGRACCANRHHQRQTRFRLVHNRRLLKYYRNKAKN